MSAVWARLQRNEDDWTKSLKRIHPEAAADPPDNHLTTNVDTS